MDDTVVKALPDKPVAMTLKDAFSIVFDLARDNIVDAREMPDENERQTVACNIAAVHARELTIPFQTRVDLWMDECFGHEIAMDKVERCDRFIEEALELVQSMGYPDLRVLMLLDYVYSRDKGETKQEVGGVMVTLSALCSAAGINLHAAREQELARVFGKVNQIREKQKGKPRHTPLPSQGRYRAAGVVGVYAKMSAACDRLDAAGRGEVELSRQEMHATALIIRMLAAELDPGAQ